MDSLLTALLIFAGAVSCHKHHHHATHHGWKQGVQYQYEMRGRNVAGLHQVSNQFVGLLTRGIVNIQARSNGRVNVQLSGSEQLELHANLSKGWRTFVPDEGAAYSPLPLESKSFDLQFNGGVVENMWVSKKAKHHELNILKAVASLLQMDTVGTNSRHLNLANDASSSFTTIEDTVSGEVETLYTINQLPKHHIHAQPSLARVVSACPNDQFLDVQKSLNFNEARHLPAYHFGMSDLVDGFIAGNQMGNMISRATNNRAILCGSVDNFLVQSTVTTDKTIVAPHLYNEQKGLVASQFNLTLINAHESVPEPSQLPDDSELHNSLNYIFNPAEPTESYEVRSIRSKRSTKTDPKSDEEEAGSTKTHNNRDEAHASKENKKHSKKGDSVENKATDESKDRDAKDGSGNTKKGSKNTENGSNKSKPTSRRSIHVNKKSRPVIVDVSEENPASSSSHPKESDSSSSSISISSSEEFMQPRPSLKSAPNNPFHPFFVGFKGQSVQSSKDINGVDIAEKLAADIAKDIGAMNTITAEMPLSKFSSLVQFLQTMNSSQMSEAATRMFVQDAAPTGKNGGNLKYATWVVFRDALAQASTGPALLAIHEQIKRGNIKGEEAAQLVATTAKMAHYPSEEYFEEFFDMVCSEHVSKQAHLNSSALISFAELVKRGFTSKSSTLNHFPVHSFGVPHSRKSKLAESKYIPHMETKLEEAIDSGDSVRIQTYTWALGQTAHPKVLDIFMPFLNGTKQVSNFQRLTMIASLNEMATVYPKLVRPVMYKIYQNIAEEPELRIASVMQIMKTNPPAQLLQRMAEFTNYETSKQVNSAVKAAIENAASKLKTNGEEQLYENAKSAVDLLTKFEYGSQYSKVHVSSWAKPNIPLSYHHELTRIQSEDSIYPSSIFCSMRRQLGGFVNYPSNTFVSTSSPSNLWDLMASYFKETVPQMSKKKVADSGSSPSWSHEDLLNKIGLASHPEEQVEGNIFASWFGAQRIFAFDNHTIAQWPQMFKETVDDIRGPKILNFTKIFDQLSLNIALPTAMGLPMTYSFNVPTIVSANGQVQGKVYPDPTRREGQILMPRTVNISAEVNLLYSSLAEGKMSLVTPFNQKQYSAGLRRQIQFALPLKFAGDFDFENTKLRWKAEPLQSADTTKLFEYSTIPYTSSNRILRLPSSPSQDQIVNVRPPKKSHFTVPVFGMSMELRAETQQEFLSWSNIYEAVRRHDMMTAMMYPFAEEAINFNNFSLTYKGHQNHKAGVEGALNYKEWSADQVASEDLPASKKHESKRGRYAHPSTLDEIDAELDSQKRELEMTRQAVDGITGAGAQYFDVSMKFLAEPHDRKFIASVAMGSCQVCENSRSVIFAYAGDESKNSDDFKMHGHVNISSPKIHLMNFKKAAEEKASVKFNGELVFGQTADQSRLNWRYKMSKTDDRSNAFKLKEMAKVCKSQMDDGYMIQPACRNVTGRAGFMDKYEFNLNYENVPSTLRRLGYISYTIARYYFTDYMSETIVGMSPTSTPEQINAIWTVSPSSKNLNLSINSPAIDVEFTDVPVDPLVRPIIVAHPYYSATERVLSKLTRRQYFPACALEGHLVNTFDNRTYPTNFGKCWYTMAISQPKSLKDAPYPIDSLNVSVLVKSATADQRELMIMLDNNTIHLKPDQHMYWNGQSSQLSSKRVAEFWDDSNRTVAASYILPDNVVVVESELYKLQVMYDGTRVLLQVANSFRGRLRGLCGNFNGEKIDDLMLPQDCMHNNPYEFASAYIAPSKSCEPLDLVSSSGFKCLAKDGTSSSVLAGEDHSSKPSKSGTNSSTPHDNNTAHHPRAHA